jgi:hypothetical protein
MTWVAVLATATSMNFPPASRPRESKRGPEEPLTTSFCRLVADLVSSTLSAPIGKALVTSTPVARKVVKFPSP